MILHLSVQHTGTWSTNAYLSTHTGIDGFQQYNRFGREDRIVGLKNMDLPERLGERMIVHKHVDHTVVGWAHILSRFFPVVMPCRDPLAALVTRHGRHPEKAPHTPHLECWPAWADICGFAHVIPVDLDPDWAALSRYCGLEPAEPPDIQNESGRYALDDAYDVGDTETLERGLGESWRTLRSMEDRLRPTLEKLGYRDLLWWSP